MFPQYFRVRNAPKLPFVYLELCTSTGKTFFLILQKKKYGKIDKLLVNFNYQNVNFLCLSHHYLNSSSLSLRWSRSLAATHSFLYGVFPKLLIYDMLNKRLHITKSDVSLILLCETSFKRALPLDTNVSLLRPRATFVANTKFVSETQKCF